MEPHTGAADGKNEKRIKYFVKIVTPVIIPVPIAIGIVNRDIFFLYKRFFHELHFFGYISAFTVYWVGLMSF